MREHFFGQEKDNFQAIDSTISKKVAVAVTDRFPMTRLINVEYTNTLPYNFSSNYLGTDHGESKVNSSHHNHFVIYIEDKNFMSRL